MVWALALGGMQDVGQNGPENEVNPLIDNGFMYTTDGWGTIYKIDARDPNKGEFVWVTDPGVKHQGNRPRTRGIALWEDLVIANLPDGRVIALNRDTGEIVWDKMVAVDQRVRQPGTLLYGADHGRRQGHHRQRRGRRQDARLDRGARRANRQGALALVRGAQAGRSRQRNLEGQEQRLENRRRRPLADRLLRSRDASSPSGARATRFRIYDPQARPGDNLYTNSAVALNIDTGKLAWHFQYTPNDSWDYDEVGIHMLYDTTINGQRARSSAHFARNGFFYSLDRTNGKFIKADQYVNDLNWTKGLNPEDRQAARIRSEARRADLQSRGARAARRPA